MYNNDDDGVCSSNQQSEKDAFTIFACQNCIFTQLKTAQTEIIYHVHTSRNCMYLRIFFYAWLTVSI